VAALLPLLFHDCPDFGEWNTWENGLFTALFPEYRNQKELEQMRYTEKEVLDYIREEDVKFVRLVFCDIFGVPKNISIFAGELENVFQKGAFIDPSAVRGLESLNGGLILRPDPGTLAVLPWRPHQGRVVRMYCDIFLPDGTAFEGDGRRIIKNAASEAVKAGVECDFSMDMDFYLFKTDEQGRTTREPLDHAGYMDISPEDGGENVRREICLTLEEMGISPLASQHMAGPGQNKIYCRPAGPLEAADDCVTFKTVVKTVAAANGLCADFSPAPLEGAPGNAARINILPEPAGGDIEAISAGLRSRSDVMSVFLNGLPEIKSARRGGEPPRIEVGLKDSAVNPYIAFALLLSAAAEGVTGKTALDSEFISSCLPKSITGFYSGK